MRNQGWEDMFTNVNDFSLKHDIQLPDMDVVHMHTTCIVGWPL
jgi:hypothetical protein